MYGIHTCAARRCKIGFRSATPRHHARTPHRLGHRNDVGNRARPHGWHAHFQFRHSRFHQRTGDRDAIRPAQDNTGGLFSIA